MGRDIWISRDTDGVFSSAHSSEKLTSGPLGFDSVTPSADGKKLFVLGTQARAELLRHDATSNTFHPFLGGISASDVEISRDGQWATYVDYPELTLWRSRIDGSERMQLSFAPTEAFKPQWSPDGRRIAFTDLRPASRARVFVVSRDGGIPAPILPDDPNNEIDPSWSPDGKSIVFARSHLDPELAIFEADLSTREVRILPGSKNLTGPVLSPDGRYLVALSRDWMSLMLYDTQAQKWQQLIKADSLGIGYPNWSSNGSWVYYRIGRTVSRTRITDRRTEQVVDLSSIPEANPLWIGLAQDDSILLHRDTSVRDIYTLTLSPPQ
jgi:Tol biopolymer transport system component